MCADRKAKAGAIRFIGEKRFEQAGAHRIGNANAGVAHFHHGDAGSGKGANGERAAIGHRVNGIQHKVEKYLAQLVEVTYNRVQIGSGCENELDRRVAHIQTSERQCRFKCAVDVVWFHLTTGGAVEIAHALGDASNAGQLIAGNCKEWRLANVFGQIGFE